MLKDEIDRLRAAGEHATRHRWLVGPLRALLFPLMRPYLLAVATRPPAETAEQLAMLARGIAETADRLAPLPARIDETAGRLDPLAARLERLADEVAALRAAQAELARTVEIWGVAGGDLRAIGHRLADLEDELIELRRPPG
ncbi:MAG: hypothetical protein U1E53_04240 [Dongiaceae bacterium]